MSRSQFLDWEAVHEIEAEMIKRARRQAEREARGQGSGLRVRGPEVDDG